MQYEAIHCGGHEYFESLSVSQEGPEDLWLSFRYREGYNYGRWGSVIGVVKGEIVVLRSGGYCSAVFGKSHLRSA